MAINENDYTDHEVTVRRLATTVDEIWNNKIKPTFATKAEAVTNVEWDSTNNKITKTVNGTTTDVVTASDMKSSMSLTKSDVGLGNVDNTSDATKKSNFTGALADGSTGFVTGDAVYDALALKADLSSPVFTGTPTAPTPSAGDDSTQIATTAFVNTAVEQGLSTADALIYKGTVAGGNTGAYGALTPTATKGWTYKVTTAGKIDGVAVEVGDMLICNDDVDAATAENYETVVSKWDFVQGNTEGIVVGPASSTNGHVALFDGVTGKLVKDGGALGTAAFKDAVSAWQSTTDNNHVPTEKLVSDSLSNKVDKVSGKGLSANDFTDAYKGNVDANTSARHSHSNKSVIDGITSTDVSNWNGKQNALTYADGKYAINISGNADSATSATNALYAFNAAPGSNLANAIASDADVAVLRYGESSMNDALTFFSQGKKLYLKTAGTTSGGVRYEYTIPLTFIYTDSSGNVNGFCFEIVTNNLVSAQDVGALRRWTLKYDGQGSSEWTGEGATVNVTNPYYADNAGNANHAASSDKAILDGGGADIRGTYVKTVNQEMNYVTVPKTTLTGVGRVDMGADADGFRYATVHLENIPISTFWSKYVYAFGYYYHDGQATPTFAGYEGVYVCSGSDSYQYGVDGYTSLGHLSSSVLGFAQIGNDNTLTQGGYITVEFDIVVGAANLSYAVYDNPPNFLKVGFAMRTMPKTWGERAKGWTFGDMGDSIFTNLTIPCTGRGKVSYGHVRLCGALLGSSFEDRLVLGASNTELTDGCIFVRVENINATWTFNRFDHT